jgi:hypothetical protein
MRTTKTWIGRIEACAPIGAGDHMDACVMDKVESVRGRMLVLTRGRRGTPEDSLAVGAALLFDAALEGAVDVHGRRVVGLDRRRVIPGATTDDRCSAPLVADVRRRVETAGRDTPTGWCERLATFAAEAAAGELVAGGHARPLAVPWWKRLVRHRSLELAAPGVAEAIKADLANVAAGRSSSPVDIALGAALHGYDVADGTLSWRDERRLGHALEAAAATLPASARLIAEALRDRRRRADNIGTWYADD